MQVYQYIDAYVFVVVFEHALENTYLSVWIHVAILVITWTDEAALVTNCHNGTQEQRDRGGHLWHV